MGFDDVPQDFSHVDMSESGVIDADGQDMGDAQIGEDEEPEYTPEPNQRRDDYDNLKELTLPSSDGMRVGDPMLTSEERRNLDTAHFGQKSSVLVGSHHEHDDVSEAQLLHSLERVVEETARDDNTISEYAEAAPE